MDLTPEERRKIYEEEKAKITPDITRFVPVRQQSLLTKNLGIDGVVFGVMIILGIFFVPGALGWLLLIAGAALLLVKLVK